ncbi:MAG: hypothetical protein LBL87_00465 [Ruminococcus sp.]|jgi:hypothetical protein|nr:hypothetical protein [Ruminococcus sp.]
MSSVKQRAMFFNHIGNENVVVREIALAVNLYKKQLHSSKDLYKIDILQFIY